MVDWARTELAQNGYALWLAGCAVGKTYAALELAREYHTVLVLSVKGAIIDAWTQDIKNGTENVRLIAPMKGTVPQRLQAIKDALAIPYEGTNIVAINYEAAYIMRKDLENLPFGLVIADEVHKLKSYNSKTSQGIAMALRNVPHHIGMTGTAFNDKPIDLYGIFRFFEPVKYASARAIVGSRLFGGWSGFFERYATYYTMENIKIPTGYKNLNELAAQVDPHTFYLNTEDVFSKRHADAPVILPDLRHIDIHVDMSPEMQRAYTAMLKDMVTTFGDQLMVAECALAQATRLHQLTSGVWTDTETKVLSDGGRWVNTNERYFIEGANPKVDAVLELADQFGKEPFVVFTRFTSDVHALEVAFKKARISRLKLVGGTYEHDRWRNGEAQALIVNMSAGSTGVNLQRANYAVYMSTGFSRSEYDQSTWRIRRPTGDLTTPKVLYHILVNGSIDNIIREVLTGKGDTTELLLKEFQQRI